jgi:hypothetical protein
MGKRGGWPQRNAKSAKEDGNFNHGSYFATYFAKATKVKKATEGQDARNGEKIGGGGMEGLGGYFGGNEVYKKFGTGYSNEGW